ncbi:MAG TPA: SDR family NAD(P)-dependent oxidoreductase [Thermoanaerobaculia bacterium]|nr:SDR family NAD(P)-dependent oxidoreductase [Thermoanaerobaculia bacterium]
MTRVAIVTGGTSGLGLEIARLLRERGMHVITVSRRETADVQGDASRAETVQRVIAAADAAGTLSLLVNCAGSGTFGAAGSYDEARVREIIDANLVSTILFCDALFPRFARDGGTIVNVLSTAALLSKVNESVYSAAKWGARGYTDVLKAEAKGTKARVISVAPGGMRTAFWEEDRAGFMEPAAVAQVVVEAIAAPVNVSAIVIER